jgi:hypothetical protein
MGICSDLQLFKDKKTLCSKGSLNGRFTTEVTVAQLHFQRKNPL